MVAQDQLTTSEIREWDGADLRAVADEALRRQRAEAMRVEAERAAQAEEKRLLREGDARIILRQDVQKLLGVTAYAETREIEGVRRPVIEADGVALTSAGRGTLYAVRPCPGCGKALVDDRSFVYDLASLAAVLAMPLTTALHDCPGALAPAAPEDEPIDEDAARVAAKYLRQFAGRAWTALEAREQEAAAEAARTETARRAGVLARVLRRELGVVAEPTGGTIDLDGVTLRLDEDGYAEGHLYAVLPCPGCGETVDNRVTSLASLGRQIAQPLKCRACRQLAQAGEDGSTTDRLVAALLAFVEETVDGRG